MEFIRHDVKRIIKYINEKKKNKIMKKKIELSQKSF